MSALHQIYLALAIDAVAITAIGVMVFRLKKSQAASQTQKD